FAGAALSGFAQSLASTKWCRCKALSLNLLLLVSFRGVQTGRLTDAFNVFRSMFGRCFLKNSIRETIVSNNETTRR
ncbi:MAG TPA: hypothetical protein DDW52_05250, partial [Planctomycetaceae bacterium]|nr:hypothetical protein [Planctomycetaceae bacterium]